MNKGLLIFGIISLFISVVFLFIDMGINNALSIIFMLASYNMIVSAIYKERD